MREILNKAKLNKISFHANLRWGLVTRVLIIIQLSFFSFIAFGDGVKV